LTEINNNNEIKFSAKYSTSYKNSFSYQFISIQSTPYIEKFAGFWILRDIELIS